MRPEERLQELPVLTPPRGNFDAFVIEGNLLYLSGKGSPLRQDTRPMQTAPPRRKAPHCSSSTDATTHPGEKP